MNPAQSLENLNNVRKSFALTYEQHAQLDQDYQTLHATLNELETVKSTVASLQQAQAAKKTAKAG